MVRRPATSSLRLPLRLSPSPHLNLSLTPNLAAIESVRTAIRAGESVVFPTDTVYGIGADPFSPQAVQGLLDAKHRGRDMPPPVLIGDADVLEAYTRDVPAAARLLANRYWPGPLTLILTAQSSLRMDLGETKGSIGVRVPDHEVRPGP